MLKRLTLQYRPLGLLFVGIVAILCMSRDAETRKYEHQKNGNQVNAIPWAKDKASKGTEENEKPQNPPGWIETFAWPEGATAWALLLTLFVIGWQSIETRNAANGAQRAADGTLQQIQLIKDKERARLTLHPLPLTEIERVPWQWVEIRIENFGYTHALNVRIVGRCELTDSEEEPPDEGAKDSTALSIVRSNSEPAKVRLEMASSIQDEITPIVQGMYVHLWGAAVYEDIFSDTHSIRFQYVFKIFRLGDMRLKDEMEVLPISALSQLIGWKKCSHPKHNRQT